MEKVKETILKYCLLFFICTIFFSCNQREDFYNSSDYLFLQTINGKYLSTRRNENNLVRGNGDNPHEWEKYIIEKTTQSKAHIITSDSLYLSFSASDSLIYASAAMPKETEEFILVPHKEYYQIQTKTGLKLALDNNKTLRTTTSSQGTNFYIKTKNNTSETITSLRQINFKLFFFQFLLFILLVWLTLKTLFKKQNSISFKTLLILGFIWAYVLIHNKNWKTNHVIHNDSIIYYEYLPATFIFKDLTFDFVSNLPSDFNGHIWLNDPYNKGDKVPKFTMGLSIMYMPFFLMGHIVAHFSNFSTYGYSMPYFIFICIGTWFYAFLGLFYLRRILLLYFNETVTGFTLIGIALSTNLFNYVVQDTAMSHAYSFFLFSSFIWQTIKWHQNKTIKKAILLGLTMGLISLIRPTNALLALVFVLYDVKSLKELKEKMKLFWNYKLNLGFIILFSILVWVPQLIFWKYNTGHWFCFSYGEEGFFFSSPKILEGLFSYRKGWLVYTPIMMIAMVGLVFLYRQANKWFLPVVVFLPLNIYVVYSWWCWWYGGGYGSRPMIDSYALMAIPLASFFSFFDVKTNYLRSLSLFIIVFSAMLNCFQTLQAKTILHYDGMTKEAYWSNFTLLNWPSNYQEQIAPPNYDKALKGLSEYKWQ